MFLFEQAPVVGAAPAGADRSETLSLRESAVLVQPPLRDVVGTGDPDVTEVNGVVEQGGEGA